MGDEQEGGALRKLLLHQGALQRPPRPVDEQTVPGGVAAAPPVLRGVPGGLRGHALRVQVRDPAVAAGAVPGLPRRGQALRCLERHCWGVVERGLCACWLLIYSLF